MRPGERGRRRLPLPRGDPACDAGGVCQGTLCAACSGDIAGCPCEAGACADLVCDTDSFTCRGALTCADLSCLERQLCTEGNATTDARCAMACEAGYVWDGASERCQPMAMNCTPGHPASLDETCAAEGRLCVTTATSAECGACVEGRIEVEGSCVSPITCAALDCASMHRECVASTPTAHASCGDCLAGYVVGAGGTCAPDPDATCDSGSDLLAACDADNRECGATLDAFGCLGCKAGFIEDGETGACRLAVTCADLDCAANDRACVPSATGDASCGDCLPETPVDDGMGGCRAALTCDDLTCAEGQVCVPGDAADARCVGDACDPTERFDLYSGTCVSCPASCALGRAPQTVYQGEGVPGVCVCETAPGTFLTAADPLVHQPCDEDGDGWLRASAREAIEVDDVEAGERDAVDQDPADVLVERRAAQHRRHPIRRVGAVAAHSRDEEPVEAPPGEDGAHDRHVAAVRALEGGVVHAHDVRHLHRRRPRTSTRTCPSASKANATPIARDIAPTPISAGPTSGEHPPMEVKSQQRMSVVAASVTAAPAAITMSATPRTCSPTSVGRPLRSVGCSPRTIVFRGPDSNSTS